jgi:hypothetical protein
MEEFANNIITRLKMQDIKLQDIKSTCWKECEKIDDIDLLYVHVPYFPKSPILRMILSDLDGGEKMCIDIRRKRLYNTCIKLLEK